MPQNIRKKSLIKIRRLTMRDRVDYLLQVFAEQRLIKYQTTQDNAITKLKSTSAWNKEIKPITQ